MQVFKCIYCVLISCYYIIHYVLSSSAQTLAKENKYWLSSLKNKVYIGILYNKFEKVEHTAWHLYIGLTFINWLFLRITLYQPNINFLLLWYVIPFQIWRISLLKPFVIYFVLTECTKWHILDQIIFGPVELSKFKKRVKRKEKLSFSWIRQPFLLLFILFFNHVFQDFHHQVENMFLS